MIIIDKRLKEAEGEMNLTENFNRILALVDKISDGMGEMAEALNDIGDQIESLDERVTALEPTPEPAATPETI